MSGSSDRKPKNAQEALVDMVLDKIGSMSKEELAEFIADRPKLRELADPEKFQDYLHEAVTGRKPPPIQ